MRVKLTRRDRKFSIVFSILLAALVFTSTVQTVAADENGSRFKSYSDYEKLQQIASSKGKVKVIVKLKVPKIKELTAESNRFCTVEPGQASSWNGVYADMALMDAINFAADNVMCNLNGTEYQVNRIYSSIPYMALDVSPEALAILQDQPDILDIIEDKPIKLIDPVGGSEAGRAKGSSHTSTTSDLSKPMLDNTVGIIGADNAWGMGYTGSGWYVAVLDTGIRSTHEFFQGKTILEACFAQGYPFGSGDCPNNGTTMTGPGSAAHYPDTYYAYDHGTHVAGIATGNNGSLYGVAKDANIIAVQVFSMFPAGEYCGASPCVLTWNSDNLAGLDYIYQIRGSCSIASVNMSLGGGGYGSACDTDPRKAAIDNLRTVGIATVIATGNNGYCNAVGSPACISSAVSVGASSDNDLESYFNNWHATLQKLFAPGINIYSSTGDSDSSYEGWSGTSMATPHVAGAWALLKQANPTGTVAEFLTALQTTGVPITSSCDNYSTPIPRIQVDAAINELVGINITSPNGGEKLQVGSQHNITWDAQGVGDLKITLWQGETKLGTIVDDLSPSPGSYAWTVGDYIGGSASLGTGYTIKISEKGTPVSDTSDAPFDIIDLTVTSPNGGEDWQIGSLHNITWDAQGVGDLKITLWQGETKLGTIADNLSPSPASYAWTVGQHSNGTASPGSGYIIKISEKGTSVSDTNDAPFNITGGKVLTVTSPNGGEDWPIGSQHNITWDALGVGDLKITLWKNGIKLGTIADNLSPSPGSYTWTVGQHSGGTALPGTGYSIKISEKGTTVSDTSDTPFDITGITVTYPNGGETWQIGTSQDITWVAQGVGDLKITLWQGETKLGTIADNLSPSPGSYAWTVGQHSNGTASPGSGYTIKISEKGTPVSDASDGPFTLY